MMRRLLWFGLTVAAAAGSAEAQVTVQVAPAIAPVLGNVVLGSSATTFSATTAGVVTRTSGNAIRLTNGSVTTPTVTITCTITKAPRCTGRYVQVTIQLVTGSGPARISKFRVGGLSGTSFRDGTPADAASMSFVLGPLRMQAVTLKIGLDALIAASATSGYTTFGYSVAASLM